MRVLDSYSDFQGSRFRGTSIRRLEEKICPLVEVFEFCVSERAVRAVGREMKEKTYYQMLVSPKIGGAAKVALAVGEFVQKTGAGRSRILVPRHGVALKAVQDLGLWSSEYNLDKLVRGNRAAVTIESVGLLRKTAFSAGVIHFHSPVVFGAARLFRKLSGLKSVLHIHLDFHADDLQWAFRRPPDLTIVCAEFMQNVVLSALAECGSRRGAVRVIRNAVDLERFCYRDKSAAKWSIGADGQLPLAMVVANLSPHKGQMTCIHAIATLKRRARRVQLWIVGESRDSRSSYEDELRAACVELGIADLVRFVGFRNDTEILFRAADFVLLPSISEGLPLSILEAQASGAVVLAAPTAGIPEVVFDGRTGFLVAADDPEGYACRIEQLIDDEVKACEMRISSRRYVEKEHDLQAYCGRVVAEYESLLGGGGNDCEIV